VTTSASRSRFVELPVLSQLCLEPGALRVKHALIEAIGAARDGRADPAQADDAQGRARHLASEKALRPRALPLAGAHEPVALDETPPHGQDQREGEVGRGGVQDAGRVRDGDPSCRAGLHVDAVVPDAEVGDEPQ